MGPHLRQVRFPVTLFRLPYRDLRVLEEEVRTQLGGAYGAGVLGGAWGSATGGTEGLRKTAEKVAEDLPKGSSTRNALEALADTAKTVGLGFDVVGIGISVYIDSQESSTSIGALIGHAAGGEAGGYFGGLAGAAWCAEFVVGALPCALLAGRFWAQQARLSAATRAVI